MFLAIFSVKFKVKIFFFFTFTVPYRNVYKFGPFRNDVWGRRLSMSSSV